MTTTLRPISSVLPEQIQLLANDPRVGKHLRATFPYPYTLDDAKKFLSLCQDDSVFGIFEGKDFVGVVSLQVHHQPEEAEVGYWIGVPYWGQGIATRAVEKVIHQARGRFERLIAKVFLDNPASCRVLEKAGFEYQGVELGEHVYRLTLSETY
ncbi:GNAT family N-acetyltransferase [Leadbetterella byssophila]|jgi:ribosomal-protein-alanine N-acetyltransferase|uniref:GNAT family N-acetyltransferase n=1 Tax=Leadbetterella byssophila TaxID=316068 RepID=UPI0039A357E3